MESMFSVRIIRRKPGIGPKPKKKKQITPCDNTQIPKSPQNVLEPSKPVFHPGHVSCNETSVIDTDEVNKSYDEHDKGGEFSMEGYGTKEDYEPEEEYETEEEYEPEEENEPKEQDPEEEYEPEEEQDPEEENEPEEEEDPEEEYEPEEEHDPEEDGMLYYDNKEFVNAVVQEGDESEFEAEENNVGEEEEGVGSLSLEDMGDVVEEKIEYVAADEIESDKDDDMPRDEVEDEMVNTDDEEFHEAHEALNERHKKKRFEVFVGGLDNYATEGDIRKVFGKVGKVVDIELKKDPSTKKNKGFAFIRFATVEQANCAVTEFRNPLVNGKQCGVRPCKDNDTLFVGNICKIWTKGTLEEKLKQFGIEKFEDLLLVEDANHAGMNRGFAFLEFSSHSDAMSAYKRLQKRDVVLGVDRSAKVCFAYPSIDSGDKIIRKVKKIFLDGVPTSWDENYVRDHLKKFGKIEKIDLARYKPSAKRKDYGFVTFNSHEAAVACAEAINNAGLCEGDKKVNVKARLSQPFQRRWKHLVRGNYLLQQGPASRGVNDFRVCPASRGISKPGTREIKPRMELSGANGFKRPVSYRDRQSSTGMSGRSRPLPPPLRSCDKKSSVSFYHKSSTKKYYGRQAEFHLRNRAAAEYASRVVKSYRSGYPSRGSGNFADVSRSVSHSQSRSEYVDDMSEHRFARTPPSHCKGHAYEYDSYSGSKRRYTELENIPPSFPNTQVRQSRARLDCGIGRSDSHYADDYSNRTGISHPAYVASSRSLPSRQSYGHYYSCQDIDYDGCSFGDAYSGGTYSPSYGDDYICPVGDQSYLSLYSSRRSGSTSYFKGGSLHSNHESGGSSYSEGGSIYSSHKPGGSSYFKGGSFYSSHKSGGRNYTERGYFDTDYCGLTN